MKSDYNSSDSTLWKDHPRDKNVSSIIKSIRNCTFLSATCYPFLPRSRHFQSDQLSSRDVYYLASERVQSVKIVFARHWWKRQSIIVQEITRNIAKRFQFYALIAIEHSFSMHEHSQGPSEGVENLPRDLENVNAWKTRFEHHIIV